MPSAQGLCLLGTQERNELKEGLGGWFGSRVEPLTGVDHCEDYRGLGQSLNQYPNIYCCWYSRWLLKISLRMKSSFDNQFT